MGPTFITLISILTGITRTATRGTSIHISTQLTKAMSKMSTTLGELHTQINSLADVVLQNRWVLDLLTKAEGAHVLS